MRKSDCFHIIKKSAPTYESKVVKIFDTIYENKKGLMRKSPSQFTLISAIMKID